MCRQDCPIQEAKCFHGAAIGHLRGMEKVWANLSSLQLHLGLQSSSGLLRQVGRGLLLLQPLSLFLSLLKGEEKAAMAPNHYSLATSCLQSWQGQTFVACPTCTAPSLYFQDHCMQPPCSQLAHGGKELLVSLYPLRPFKTKKGTETVHSTHFISERKGDKSSPACSPVSLHARYTQVHIRRTALGSQFRQCAGMHWPSVQCAHIVFFLPIQLCSFCTGVYLLKILLNVAVGATDSFEIHQWMSEMIISPSLFWIPSNMPNKDYH